MGLGLGLGLGTQSDCARGELRASYGLAGAAYRL